MDFSLSDDEADFLAGARDIAKGLAEKAFTWDGDWPTESVKMLADHGYLGVSLPEAVGGGGLSPMYAALLIGAVGEVCPDTAQAVRFTNFGPANHIARLGSAELAARYLPQVIAGDSVLAIAISEPEAGSAANDITTVARVEGDEIVINGFKIYSTEADIAAAFVVLVRFPEGVGSVVVDRDAPGFEIVSMDTNMSGGKQGHLLFTECRVPVANRLVSGSEGIKEQFSVYNFGRLGSALVAIAAADLGLRLALEYTKERVQFGTRIADFQGIRWMLAERATELEAARYLTYRAVTSAEQPGSRPVRMEASMAKLFATDVAGKVIDDSLQMFGAMGYMRGSQLEYLYRFVRAFRISGGTTQMQKNMIAAEIHKRGLPRIGGANA